VSIKGWFCRLPASDCSIRHNSFRVDEGNPHGKRRAEQEDKGTAGTWIKITAARSRGRRLMGRRPDASSGCWLAANLIYMKSRGEASREDDVIKILPARRIDRNSGHIRRVRGITCLVFVQFRQLPRPQLFTALLHRLFPGDCDQSPNATQEARRRFE